MSIFPRPPEHGILSEVPSPPSQGLKQPVQYSFILEQAGRTHSSHLPHLRELFYCCFSLVPPSPERPSYRVWGRSRPTRGGGKALLYCSHPFLVTCAPLRRTALLLSPSMNPPGHQEVASSQETHPAKFLPSQCC